MGLFPLWRYVQVDPRDTEHVTEFQRSLQEWADSRFLSRDQVETLAMFVMYLVNLAEHDGWTLRGYSWKEADYLGCLVVKATRDGVPLVAFTSAKTAINGMRIFLKKLEGDFVEWTKDKYG